MPISPVASSATADAAGREVLRTTVRRLVGPDLIERWVTTQIGLANGGDRQAIAFLLKLCEEPDPVRLPGTSRRARPTPKAKRAK